MAIHTIGPKELHLLTPLLYLGGDPLEFLWGLHIPDRWMGERTREEKIPRCPPPPDDP